MRLGLLGPAEGDLDALARAAESLVDRVGVDRAIYLGPDGALDEAVARLAARVVGDDPSDDAAWKRAARVAVGGAPNDIDAFVRAERARQRLRVLEGLPQGGDMRTVEMIGDRVAILLYDKAALDEEDIYAATLLVYGKSPMPLVRKVGTRWFVSPGSVRSGSGGAAVLDDSGEDILATVYTLDGLVTLQETIVVARATKMRVQGSNT